ncbi:MAG TPA: chemotaxis response regulator protein-glutamate methylesterase [Clostridiales bacterium]|nr:chemotaxis response regulator protein-glutamate methylesterase [Clostridiales bacterium]
MKLGKKIRVLVVDDSLIFREVLSRGLSSDINIDVVAVANDPFDARDKIIKYKPDVMTCDVEMPKMNGIEFIRRLLPQYPLPVIIVSGVNAAVFDAMNAGAVDFVTKPDIKSAKSVEDFLIEMIDKIKVASAAKVIKSDDCYFAPKPGNNPDKAAGRIIAIGASTGGTEAIYHILKELPSSSPGIVIVQHIPPVFSQMFAKRLNASTNLEVKEAETGDYVEAGKVLIAPGDLHMKIKKNGDRYRIECFEGDKLNGHCPSVDILFESVAKEAGENAIGVILTGMGYDGAKGLLAMKRNGARTIGQNEETSVVYGMPKVAYNIGAVERQAFLGNIPNMLCSLFG